MLSPGVLTASMEDGTIFRSSAILHKRDATQDVAGLIPVNGGLTGERMYEAYAAMLVGIVSAAGAIGALIGSRHLSPLFYTAVHLIATLFMIMLVTFGYEAVPPAARTAPAYMSRLIYLGVSSVMFVNTMLIHAVLNRSKETHSFLSSLF
jgi:hypothetical protein